MNFKQSIAQYISRHGLMRHDGFYVVALSGGADSVALLRVLRALGYRLVAVHCNFGLRGEESTRDENFCISLCQELQVPLHRAHFDTRTYAEAHGVSIEMAARELRYRYFEQLRADIGADAICVAHHRDDQVETVLLNLVRGTGIAGLQGMRPCNGHVLRPMLHVSRADVLAYLDDLKQPYVTDSSNLEADVQRNKLRLNIIPMLRELNPAVSENITRMAENVAEAGKMLEAATREALASATTADGGYDLSALAALPSPQYALWSMVGSRGFNRVQMMEMLAHGRSGARWESATHMAFVDRGNLYVVHRDEWTRELPVLKVPEGGTYCYAMPQPSILNEPSAAQPLRFRVSTMAVGADYHVGRLATAAHLDADRVPLPLTIRPLREGDRFVPLGMRGSKLVSDFLADRKVPMLQRRQQLVVCDAEGRIAWLVGRRIDQRAAVMQNRTRRVLLIELL